MGLYEQIAEEGLRLASEMGIFGRNNSTNFIFDHFKNQLKPVKDFEVVSFEEIDLDSENPSVKKTIPFKYHL